MNKSHDAAKHPKQQASLSKAQTIAPGVLLLVRHAESEWNVLGKWTGRTDVHLTSKGRDEAAKLGEILGDIELHHAFTSEQIRTVETLIALLQKANMGHVPHERSASLNERDYGDYTGLNKWEVLEQLGEEVFTKIRRSWDHPIPNGETLAQVHERAVPFYKDYILPRLLAGSNVLVVSHGNTIRSLIKYLEDISDEGIEQVEMPFGQILVYNVWANGKRHTKELRQIALEPPHA